MQPLELLGNVDEPADDRLLLHGLLELRLALDRLGQRHRVRRVLRHQLGQLVDLPVGHLQDAADIAQHAAGEQRAEGDDLPDLPLAVALLHVADHPLAALDAEVDVEIRHRDALGVQEALEQQAEAQRVEVGDEQRPCHQRAGAGAAARSHRDVVVLGPLDEVGDDQEVARELHRHDDVELEGEALAVILFGEAGRGAVLLQAQLEPGLGLTAQFGRLVGRDRLGARLRNRGQRVGHRGLLPRRHGAEIRQDRLAGPGPHGAAHGDLHRGLEGLRQIAEQFGHLGPRLEGMARRHPPTALVGDDPPLRDGQQGVMGVVIVGLGEIGLVRRDDAEAVTTGEVEERGLHPPLFGQPVALELDVEPVLAEGRLEALQTGERQFGPARPEGHVEGARHAAGERDQAVRGSDERRGVEAGGLAERGVEIGPAREPQQVGVAGLVLGKQHDPVARRGVSLVGIRGLEGHRELHACDRLHALPGRLLREFERPEQVVGVGERQGRLPVGDRGLDQGADLQGAFEQGIGRVDMEVDEADLLELTWHGRPCTGVRQHPLTPSPSRRRPGPRPTISTGRAR